MVPWIEEEMSFVAGYLFMFWKIIWDDLSILKWPWAVQKNGSRRAWVTAGLAWGRYLMGQSETRYMDYMVGGQLLVAHSDSLGPFPTHWHKTEHEIIGWESGLVLESGPSMIPVWC